MRVLLISNNPLSTVENNGKTLLSYFQDWEEATVFQIWFRPELPNSTACQEPNKKMSFFRLTDENVIRRQPGELFELSLLDLANNFSVPSEESVIGLNKLYRSRLSSGTFFRLLREIPWLFYPFSSKNQNLLDVLFSFKPDLIFFCAGDSLFAYRIVETLRSRLEVPLVIYVTDDYILPYKNISPLAKFRRFLIRRSLLKMASEASLFFTIGEKMQRTYKELYGLKSQSLVNISSDHFSQINYLEKVASSSYTWQLVYAGGLHYDRDKVLLILIEAINQLNNLYNWQVFHLSIYALPHLPEECLAALNSPGSTYKGPASAEELIKINQQADVLVFVESDHPAAKRATALSLSTKVPEYQSYHRAILSIGPDSSASIEYLKQYSLFAPPSATAVYQVLLEIINNPSILQKFAEIAYRNFTERHNPNRVKNEFRQNLCNVKERHIGSS